MELGELMPWDLDLSCALVAVLLTLTHSSPLYIQLEGHLGCVLFQFPHNFRFSNATLERINKLGEYLKTSYPHGERI